jgi:hypothetical protein
MNSSPPDICAACNKPIGRDDLAVEVVDMFSSVRIIFHGRCTPTSPPNTFDRQPEKKPPERASRADKRN